MQVSLICWHACALLPSCGCYHVRSYAPQTLLSSGTYAFILRVWAIVHNLGHAHSLGKTNTSPDTMCPTIFATAATLCTRAHTLRGLTLWLVARSLCTLNANIVHGCTILLHRADVPPRTASMPGCSICRHTQDTCPIVMGQRRRHHKDGSQVSTTARCQFCGQYLVCCAYRNGRKRPR